MAQNPAWLAGYQPYTGDTQTPPEKRQSAQEARAGSTEARQSAQEARAQKAADWAEIVRKATYNEDGTLKKDAELPKVPPSATKAYIDNNSSIRQINEALWALSQYPGAIGASNLLIPDVVKQRTDPEGVDARARIANIGSLLIHDRSGAAVTASETPRLKPFIPTVSDETEAAIQKLKNLKANLQSTNEDIAAAYANDAGASRLSRIDDRVGTYPTNAPEQPPSAAAPSEGLGYRTMEGMRGPPTARADVPLAPIVRAEDEAIAAQLQDAFDSGASLKEMQDLALQLYGDTATLNSQELAAGIKYRDNFRKSGGIGPSGATVVPRETAPTREQSERVQSLQDPANALMKSAGVGLTLGTAPLFMDDRARANLEYMREQSPKASFAGELLGSIGPSMGLGVGARTGSRALMGLFGREGLSAPASAAVGDITSGAIQGASGDPDNPVTGAVTGGTIASLGSLAGRYGLAPAVISAADIARIGAPKPTFAQSTIAGGSLGPVDEVEKFLREASARNLPAGLGDFNPALVGKTARYAKEGADAASSAYAGRQGDQTARAIAAVNRDVAPSVDPRVREADIEHAANMAADPYYDTVRAKPAPVDPALDQMLGTSLGQRGLRRAYAAAEADGRDPRSMGFDLNAQGDVVVVERPSWDTLIRVRKGINDELDSFRDPVTRSLDTSGNPDARNAERFLNRFTARLDNISPDYKAARAVYAAAVTPKDYLHLGLKALDDKVPVTDVQTTLNNIANIADEAQRAAALQAYREGYSTRLTRELSKTRSPDPYSRVFGSTGQQEKMRLIGTTPEDFASQVGIEGKMAATAREASPAVRAQARSDAEATLKGSDVPGAIIETAVSGAPFVTAANIARRGVAQTIRDRYALGGVRAGANARALAPELMGVDPEAALRYLQSAQSIVGNREAYMQVPRTVSTFLGGAATNAAMAATPENYDQRYDPEAPPMQIGAYTPAKPVVVGEDGDNLIMSDGTLVPKALAVKAPQFKRGGRVGGLSRYAAGRR